MGVVSDVAGFLRNERENALLSVIEETRQDTFHAAEKQHWDAVSAEWEADKMRILTALTGASASEASESFMPRAETTRIHESTLVTRSSMDAVEMTYATQVSLYNEAVTKGGLRPNLAEKLSSLFPEERDAEVALMWEMVLQMVALTPPAPSSDAVKHRISPTISKVGISIQEKIKAYSVIFCRRSSRSPRLTWRQPS